MTPPDSGERRQGKSHLHVGKECGPSCPDGNGIEFKPDSGEREVQHVVAAAFEYCRVDGEVAMHVPLPLAQRILAALESHPDLAAELRAVMPKGTR